jgi:hypothetical protein
VTIGAARLLAPAIVVLLAAGIVAAAVVGSDDEAAGPTTTTTAEVVGITTTATSTTATSTTTSTTSTTATTAPVGSATTTGTTPTSGRPGTAPTATTAAPAGPTGPADLIVHATGLPQTDARPARVRFSVENAGPAAAPRIVLTLAGVPGQHFEGDGVTCEGGAVLTCRVAASGTGELLGFVEVAVADGCPDVVASVSSSAEDPDPESNSVTAGLCR